MTEQRTVSGKWVDGLFNRALGPSIDHELAELLRAEGLELKHPLHHSYPRDQFVKWLTISARELFPGRELAEALRLLGVKVVEDLQASGNIKGPIVSMARLLGPRRVLKQLADYVQGQSSLRVKVSEKGRTSAHLELNDGELADFVAGSLQAILGLIGARAPKVDAKAVSPDRSVLELRWA
jgi:uncharacterized protein (TIGR02265 family)